MTESDKFAVLTGKQGKWNNTKSAWDLGAHWTDEIFLDSKNYTWRYGLQLYTHVAWQTVHYTRLD